MSTRSRPDLPLTTRRRLLSLTGLGALGVLFLEVRKGAEPALAAAAPLLRPDARGASSGRCAHCGSTSHTTLDPLCEAGAAPRSALQSEARRRAAGRRGAAL